MRNRESWKESKFEKQTTEKEMGKGMSEKVRQERGERKKQNKRVVVQV